jgi:(E)-4-hydroxy-3-methylbut-2-enyl-diphosphate synthase
MGCDVPLVGDFHYNGHRLLTDTRPAPGAVQVPHQPRQRGQGRQARHAVRADDRGGLKYDKPVRIGVNWGSLDQEMLAALMDENARRAEPWDARQVMYEALISRPSARPSAPSNWAWPGADHPVVQGQRRAGSDRGVPRAGAPLRLRAAPGPDRGRHGHQGHGGVHRRAVGAAAGGHRRHHPRLAHAAARRGAHAGGGGGQEILQALGLRTFVPSVTACPGCGRTTSTVFQELAKQIDDFLRAQMPVWRIKYPGVEAMKVAVMGCIVNGPGESKHADIGISLPGTGEMPAAPVFIDGEKAVTLRGEHIARSFTSWSSATSSSVLARAAPDFKPNKAVARVKCASSYQNNSIPMSGSSRISAIKGMNDILPPDSARWEWLEDVVRRAMAAHAYRNVRTPIVEHTQLFTRGLGEVTDIVEKEMYSFEDRRPARPADHLSLRPEARPAWCAPWSSTTCCTTAASACTTWAPCSGASARSAAAIASSTRSAPRRWALAAPRSTPS